MRRMNPGDDVYRQTLYDVLEGFAKKRGYRSLNEPYLRIGASTVPTRAHAQGYWLRFERIAQVLDLLGVPLMIFALRFDAELAIRRAADKPTAPLDR